MDNQLDLSYQERKDRIRGELNQVAESFVEIGYQLKQIRDGELYKADGYSNIHEFAEKEYNLSQSSTSRFMAINNCFSVDGNSPMLMEQYEGYGFSKLSEMLTLSEEEMKLVSIRTTRVEIREIKQAIKEAESSENDGIYAPAHNSQRIENTQSNQNFEGVKLPAIPDGVSLMVEFFRDRSKREVLKQLAALLRDGTSKGSISEAAAEIINPSGHLMFRKGMVILMLEVDIIKYSRFQSPTTEYTYLDFIHDTALAFDMAAVDPWVAFYREPEPEPKPEVKQEPKSESKPEKKETKEPPKETKKVTKPVDNTQPKKEPQAAGESKDNLPGHKKIEDYPELLPEKQAKVRRCRVCGCTDDYACEGGCFWVEEDLCSACQKKINAEVKSSIVESRDVEIIEADIVQTKPETTLIKMVDYEGGPVPEELCTIGADGSADDFVGCGKCFDVDDVANCENCVVNKIFKEYARLTNQHI